MYGIECAITLRCDQKCPSCSRHSGLHGPNSDLSEDQVTRFIDEVKGHGSVDVIWVTGGEPTLHPDFDIIINRFYAELLLPKTIKRLILVSNGSIPRRMPPTSEELVCRPKEKVHLFRCQYVAPCDTGQKQKDCRVPYTDGVGFCAYGWYPCGGGSAIAMLLKLDEYRKDTIPAHIDDFPSRDRLCSYCQVSAEKWMYVRDFGDIRSVSFRRAFRDFDASKLRRY